MKKKILIAIICFTSSITMSAQVIKNGYADKLSYYPNEVAHLYISGTGNFQGTKIYLLDALGNRRDSLETDITPQYPADSIPWIHGFGYHLTVKYPIPNLPSGLYSFDRKVFFIIKSTSPKAITIICPTNTFAAYDSSGGKSMYNGNSTNNQQARIVSLLRPWSTQTIDWSVVKVDGILRWLLTQPDIDYRVISDMDMDDYQNISGSQIIMLIGHSEYWTRLARRNFDYFVDNGGDAVVLSGNVMWWQVRYSPDKTQMICYRQAGLDTAVDSMKTINWSAPLLNYPVLPSIGCDWVHGAYGMESSPHGWCGYKITSPESPILKGTGFNRGDTLICRASEYDGAPLTGFDQNGYPVIDTAALGFCATELIGYDYGKRPGGGIHDTAYGTFIIFKKNRTTGVTINAAFNEFTSNSAPYVIGNTGPHASGFGGPDSVKMKQICRNIVDLLTTGQNVFSFPNECGYPVMAVNETQPIDQPVLYPVPCNGDLFMEGNRNAGFVFSVYNNYGQQVFEERKVKQENVSHFNVSTLTNGVYVYTINYSANESFSGRFLVLK